MDAKNALTSILLNKVFVDVSIDCRNYINLDNHTPMTYTFNVRRKQYGDY